ncbi:hypothetical protein QJS10_CPA02g00623 [Acorus calamus]|uniref:Uncharacterized protein n=1 Tax=Acorus calamus TaxID=4465 RepID=A0AAV9FF20_ACOCL|nr:hypothetical protein QJS10_CPA02g00623 [Acorus calamus]
MDEKSEPSITSSSTRFAHIETPIHTLGFEKKGEPVEDAFARRVGGLLSVIAPPDWVRSVGLRDHPSHGRVVAAR